MVFLIHLRIVMKSLKSGIFSVLFLFISFTDAFATVPTPPSGTTGNPSCWPPPCIPADNGVIVLITAGLLFAAKKLYDFRKKSLTA